MRFFARLMKLTAYSFRWNEIQKKLTPYLKKCGFNPKTDITYIPCSGLTGAFLKERPEAPTGSWYT